MKTLLTTSCIVLVVFLLSCVDKPQDENKVKHIIFDKPSCGYSVDITKVPQGWLYHFIQGDSIDCYIPLTILPKEVDSLISQYPSDTCVHTNFVFTEEAKMYKDFFFKDVNFDKKPDFIVTTIGRDWQDFDCYDLSENRNTNPRCALDYVSPIELQLSGNWGINAFDMGQAELLQYYDGPIFDYKNKTITMHGISGVSGEYEVVYKYVGENKFKMLWYKSTEGQPIYDESGYCVDVKHTETLYRPHPTIPDSLVMEYERAVD